MHVEMRMSFENKKAFTLLELLVVIAIIAMLTAIIMPALGKVRRQGKAVFCLSNLRQMYIAAATYTETNDDSFPIAYYETPTDTGTIRYNWDFAVLEDGANIEVTAGTLWQGDTIDKVQQCPSFKGNSNSPHDPYTGYNYNTSFIGHGQYENIPAPAKKSQIRNSAGCVLFGDGQWSGGANKFMRSPLRAPGDRTFSGRFAGTQGYRHSDKTNVVWADGHAAPFKRLFTTVNPSRYSADIEEYNEANKRRKIGFLSPDNSAYDLK